MEGKWREENVMEWNGREAKRSEVKRREEKGMEWKGSEAKEKG